MCSKGDIILVESYKDINDLEVSKHPFIIIDDENGIYKGVNIDFVCVVMSSYKNEKSRKSILKHISNYDISIKDGCKKDGYAKLDVIYYFDKNKIKYRTVGSINISTFNKILDTIKLLDCRNVIKENFNNL